MTELFPRFESLAIELPVNGAPVLSLFGDEAPNLMASVVPLGGRHFDAVLFAVRTHQPADNVVRFGSTRDAQAAAMTMAQPVKAPDRHVAWRLWERGMHPGDVRLEGELDDHGRQAVRVLVLLDFSNGFQAADDLTLPLAFRRALAEAMQVSSDARWQATAEAIDPDRALRSGRSDEAREVFTTSAIEAVMEADAAQEGESRMHPMRDFRFAETAELIADLKRAPQILAIARPDMAGWDRATHRFSAMADAFEAGDLGAFQRLRNQSSWLIANMARVQGNDGRADKLAMDEFLSMMQGEGRGAGASYFRDIVAGHGVIDTLEARLVNGEVHARFEALALAVKDAKLRRLAIDPASIPVRRTAEEIGTAIGAKDAATRLPVLALDDNPLARGKALPDVLRRAAAANPAAVRNLAGRTEYLARTLLAAKALGSRDRALGLAIERLERGSDLLAVIVKKLPKIPAGISGAVLPQQNPVVPAAALKLTSAGLMR